MEKNSGEQLVTPTGLRIVSSTDRIRQIIRHEMFRRAEDSEHETFEEADDFELDDGETWISPYEENFEPEPSEPPSPEPPVPPSPPEPPVPPLPSAE